MPDATIAIPSSHDAMMIRTENEMGRPLSGRVRVARRRWMSGSGGPGKVFVGPVCAPVRSCHQPPLSFFGKFGVCEPSAALLRALGWSWVGGWVWVGVLYWHSGAESGPLLVPALLDAQNLAAPSLFLFDTMYLSISFRESTPPQKRPLIVYYY